MITWPREIFSFWVGLIFADFALEIMRELRPYDKFSHAFLFYKYNYIARIYIRA